jgi:hypothetical protein
LVGISLEAGKTIKKVSILVRQLEKTSLSLVMAKEKEAVMIPKIGYTIYRLIIPRVQDKGT